MGGGTQLRGVPIPSTSHLVSRAVGVLSRAAVVQTWSEFCERQTVVLGRENMVHRIPLAPCRRRPRRRGGQVQDASDKKRAMAKLDEVELTMTVCGEWAAEFAKEGHAKTPSKPSCAACTWRR